MPKIIKHQPTQYVGQVREFLQESEKARENWPGPMEEQWFKKQAEIPLKIYAHPPPAQPNIQKHRGKVVWFEYAQDFDRERQIFEEAIRERTIRYIKSRPGMKLDQANWNDFAVKSIDNSCNEALGELDFLIKAGNQQAAGLLGFMAHKMVERVMAISDSHASALKVVAEHSMNWPVLRGNKSYLDDGEQFIKPLNVGGKLPFSEKMASRIPDSKTKEMMKLACKLLCRLEDWRRRDSAAIYWGKPFLPPTKAEADANSLPPFSEQSWKEWAGNAWRILLEENNNQPEKNQKLQRFGDYRKQHTEVTSQLPSGRLPDGKIPTTPNSNIRDGIKKRLEDAIKRCAGIKPKQNVKHPR